MIDMSTAHAWLIAYDITCPRRLQRLHYRLRKRAMFVQESVAVLRCNEETLTELLDSLDGHFDPGTDDLRAYRVAWPEDAWIIGPDARGALLIDGSPTPRKPPVPARSLLSRIRELVGA